MQTTTLLLLITVALVALALALFQYYFKAKRKGRLPVILTFLRFLALFGLFVLLINPKFSKNEYSIEKTNLVVLADNSSSMSRTDDGQATRVLGLLNDNEQLSNRFNVKSYRFGKELQELNDSLSFKDGNTDIAKALSSIEEIYNGTSTAVVLLTDGNQTIGTDYGFQASSLNFPIYPIVIGDTTRYEDLRIDQINVNKYAFLKNKYPIEVYFTYEGVGSVSSVLSIIVDGKTKYRETLKFSSTNRTKVLNTLLDASAVGVKSVSVRLQPLEKERNTVNNQKQVAIEVIDEKTNVAIISGLVHPDIGALTKAIESNEQRTVTLKKPTTPISDLEDVDVFILYQPNEKFKPVFDYIRQKKASSFSIGGNRTDWSFLNSIEPEISIEDGYPNQEVVPVLNPSFSKFDISNISMDEFPPLDSDAGPVVVNGDADVLITMKIRGRDMRTPLMLAKDESVGKKLFLFGENVWKWRIQSFRNDKNFDSFDEFISKLILYLSNNAAKNRLNIDYQRIYDGSGDSKITATYFDEAFVFDYNATISLEIRGVDNGFSKVIPMLLKNDFYEGSLLGVPAGEYNFTVSVVEENRSKSGAFTILDFDVEQQFLSADYRKLGQLANETEGALFYPSNVDSLISELNGSNRFAPTQKGTKNVVSLIDFRIVMALIAASLALEWFIRKYNGLI
jgi:hypothetical protein